MITLALIGLAAGGVLAQRFSVFVLWPAIAAAAILTAVIGPLAGLAAVPQLAILTTLATGLQLGYLAGSFVKDRLDPDDRGVAEPAGA